MKKIYLLVSATLLLIATDTSAQFTSLLNFNGTNGSQAQYTTLTLSGNTLYGAALTGGANNVGTIFSVNTDGTSYVDMHDFADTDGSEAVGQLILSGNVLYGMTAAGGASDSGCIYSIHTDGTHFKLIYSFSGGKYGREPVGSLTLSGNKFYGTTALGGLNGSGCIFSVDTNGKNYADMHDFTKATGSNPYCALTLVKNKLYGTTNTGGANDSGCIFFIHTDGSTYTDMFDFNGTDGARPFCTLLYSGGGLYGTTAAGGLLEDGCIFGIDTNGTGYYDMHDFVRQTGQISGCSLTLQGNTLLGMTAEGGHDSLGCIFTMNLDGSRYMDIFDFTKATGYSPQLNGITVSGDSIYGVVPYGGANSEGDVFRFVDDVLSVPSLQSNSQSILAYPNPNKGVFTIAMSGIETSSSVIQVYNILGVQVSSIKLSQASNQTTIDLSQQAAGMYLFRVLNENGNLIGEGKIEVQK